MALDWKVEFGGIHFRNNPTPVTVDGNRLFRVRERIPDDPLRWPQLVIDVRVRGEAGDLAAKIAKTRPQFVRQGLVSVFDEISCSIYNPATSFNFATICATSPYSLGLTGTFYVGGACVAATDTTLTVNGQSVTAQASYHYSLEVSTSKTCVSCTWSN